MKKQVVPHNHLSFEQMQIARYLKTLHFKTCLFGADQADVWKKIEQLNALYETALLAERARYDALLEQYCGISPGSDPDFRDEREGAMYDETGNN